MSQRTLPAFAAAVFLMALLTAPAVAQTASNLICNACVGASDIATGAVKSAEIANSTITSSDIKDGAINNQDLRNNAVTGAKIKNNTITSVDVAPSLNLGVAGNDGDFTVKTAGGAVGVRLNGDAGNITNNYSSNPSQSNGLVKAWARINTDGTVHSCWRCNPNSPFTTKIVTGRYHVDFTPLATDITARPFQAAMRSNLPSLAATNRIPTVAILDEDRSTVIVLVNHGSSDALVVGEFTVYV